jgi:DNA-binding LacI/PurR family transcriptional regulator
MTFSKQLSDILRAQISRGDFKPGARIPSERELCEIYGVSRTTVRTAVMSLVFDGLLVRHAGDGTYVHRKPESKVNGSTTKGTVAFVRCQHSDGLHQLVSDYIYSDILLGVQQTVDNEKQHVIFSYLSEVAPDVIGRVEAITKKVDGLIICEIRNKETYDKLMSLRIPIVLVNPNIHSYKSDSVDVDNVNGAYEAVEHLIHLGHQNIGIIRGRLPTSHALGRLEGYYKALDDNGIPRRDAFVVGGADWQKSSGYEAMKELLSAIPRPTAVFASSDPLAAGALQAIKEGSLNVPGDISVVGFDDMIISQHTFPALTTMQIPRGQMGRHAALRLLDLVNNPSQPMQKVVFSPILVERESTSPPRKQ